MGMASDFLELTRSHNKLLKIEEIVESTIHNNQFLDSGDFRDSLHTYIKHLQHFNNTLICHQAKSLSAERDIIVGIRELADDKKLGRDIVGKFWEISIKLEKKIDQLQRLTLDISRTPNLRGKAPAAEDLDRIAAAITQNKGVARKLKEDIDRGLSHRLSYFLKAPLASAKEMAKKRDANAPLNSRILNLLEAYEAQIDSIFIFDAEADQLLAGLIKDIEDTIRIITEVSNYRLLESEHQSLDMEKSALEEIAKKIRGIYSKELKSDDQLLKRLEALKPKLAELNTKTYVKRNYTPGALLDPLPNTILLHTLIDRGIYPRAALYKSWLDILGKILSSGEFRSGSISTSPEQDGGRPASDSVLSSRYIQTSYFSTGKKSVFGVYPISFFWTYEDLERSRAKVFCYDSRANYWAIVTIYDLSTGWYGGAEIPLENTHLAINLSVYDISLGVANLLGSMPLEWVRKNVLFYYDGKHNSTEVISGLLHRHVSGGLDIYAASRECILARIDEYSLDKGYASVAVPLIHFFAGKGYLREDEKERYLNIFKS